MFRRIVALTIVAVAAATAIAFRTDLGQGRAATNSLDARSEPVSVSAFHKIKVDPISGPDVLLISVDTLRSDHMSVYRYHRNTTPNLEAFSAQSRVFDRAYATATLTPPSVMSMLTGLYPYRHRVRLFFQRIPAECITIADHLRRAGYQTAAVVAHLCLTDSASGLGARFEYFDDELDAPTAHRPDLLERRASRTTDAAIAWLKDHRAPDRPFFLWIHYIDPHGPYTPPDDAPRDFVHDRPQPIDPQRVHKSTLEPGLTDGLEYVDRYDEEIAYADREIGRLLDFYTALGLADDSLIVFTADHGERLMDGDENLLLFAHGFDPNEIVIRIPLMIRCKSIAPGRESQPVSIADITPTVLDVVGLAVPDGLDGRSLTGNISARPPYAESGDIGRSGGLQRAFVYDRRKVVVRHGQSNIPRESWAFDVLADPFERHRLAVDEAEPAYQVLAEIIRAEPDPGGTPVDYAKGEKPDTPLSDELDAGAIRALRALGYVQ